MEAEATNPHLYHPPFWPLNLCVTSLWPSTYTSRGPWNGCSRLPPTTSAPISQHSMPGRKPPSVALGGLCSTRAEDELGMEGMDSAIPDLMATPSQAPHMWSCQKTFLASSKSVTYHPHLPCQKLQRWPASPPLHSLRLPPGLIQPTYPMRCSNCKGR